jgi:phosphoglycerate dehydrogenase-like enzyme
MAAETSPAARISVLDADHVLRLVRALLSAGAAADRKVVRTFFAPEAVDVDAAFAAAAGLRADDGGTVCEAVDANILLFRRGAVTRELIEASPGLRLVQRLGEDPTPIDLAAAREHGVAISCLPRRTLRHAAEHALMLMLALSKRLLAADRAVRLGTPPAVGATDVDGVAYNWPALTDLGGLAGHTLGVIGLGELATHVVRRARAFEMDVIYHSVAELPDERERALGVARRSLPALLAEADIVSVHVPGTAANDGLIGAPELAQMRADALLVNTSRGRVIDEDALYDALLAGRIAGAGLDVHRVEPRPIGDRFAQLDNVVLTPHIAGGSRLDTLVEVRALFDNMRAVLSGEAPPHGAVPLPGSG